jgi:hypothetical protein
MPKHRQSPALAHVMHVWGNAPTRSWTIFNNAMYSALVNAITSKMRFEEGDFKHLADYASLGRWGGDLERLYSRACGDERGSENPSAVAALEHFLKRKPFIWAEETKAPQRLYVGATFTWDGERVTVTSFNDKAATIVACSYKRERDDRAENDDRAEYKAGSETYALGEYRIVESIKKMEDGSVVCRFSAATEHATGKILHRHAISLQQLKDKRADYDKRRRLHEKAFAEATTLTGLETARLAASAEGTRAFRHFDIELLTLAMGNAKKRIEAALSERQRAEQNAQLNQAAAQRLERWVAGEDVRDYVGTEIRVRLKGNFIEVSNGNSVTVDAARNTLAFVQRHRKSGWHTNGHTHEIDGFKLASINTAGVTIGCTHFPWVEVDRCAELLGMSK